MANQPDPGLLSQRGNFLSTKGMIAVCAHGIPAIVTDPCKRQFPDGAAYIGVCILDGRPWQSKQPTFVGRFREFLDSGLSFADWCGRSGAEVRS